MAHIKNITVQGVFTSQKVGPILKIGRMIFVSVLLFVALLCKDTNETHLVEEPKKVIPREPIRQEAVIAKELVISEGSIDIDSNYDLKNLVDATDLSNQRFMEMFGESSENLKYVHIRQIHKDQQSKESLSTSVGTYFYIKETVDGKLKFKIYHDIDLGNYELSSKGDITNIKCQNLDKPRKECILFTKYEKTPSEGDGQPYQYEYIFFTVKDDYLYDIWGEDSKKIGHGFIGYKSKEGNYPKTDLLYFKNAIKILNADESYKDFLNKFKPEDLDYFLE